MFQDVKMYLIYTLYVFMNKSIPCWEKNQIFLFSEQYPHIHTYNDKFNEMKRNRMQKQKMKKDEKELE